VIRPADEPGTIVLRMSGRLERVHIAHICERSQIELATDIALVVCDVREVVDPDAVTIDALARLVLAARRLGHRVEIRDSSNRLEGLLQLVGLSNVMPLALD
jgi:ABC-type transporter Mla MlaB component